MTDIASVCLGRTLASVTMSRHADGSYSLHLDGLGLTIMERDLAELLDDARRALMPKPAPANVVALRPFHVAGGLGGFPCDSQPIDNGYEPHR